MQSTKSLTWLKITQLTLYLGIPYIHSLNVYGVIAFISFTRLSCILWDHKGRMWIHLFPQYMNLASSIFIMNLY